MKYIPTIGLELHCELETEAKVFSKAKNTYSKNPNENIVEVDMAFPGIMPFTNKEAVKKALMMALALNCQTPNELIFDRKNYYYPDLPKGYQITQNTKPVGINGKFIIKVNDNEVEVLIHDVHLEEDTASLDHFPGYSLLDYNRSGIPLLETVTEPCLHSADEAVKFLEEMRKIFKYCKISEADSKKGQIRCDVNVSLQREGDTELGTKVETKNINSFANVRETIEYEIKRQGKLLDENKDDEIIQETRRFDDNTGKTVAMRSKVDAIDYKYFIEPNLPPVKIEDEFIESIKKEIPMLAYEREQKYINEYKITPYDADILVKTIELATYFEKCINSKKVEPQQAANWINTRILSYLNKYDKTFDEINIKPEELAQLIHMIDKGDISSKQGKDMVYDSLINGTSLTELLSDDSNKQITDKKTITKMVEEIMIEHQDQVDEYDPERSRLNEFFIGMIMKKSQGKANPGISREIINMKLLESYKEKNNE